jgi:lipopolysaccharide export system permease protein
VLKIVDRMILSELRGPFLFGVGLFSALTIATVVMQEALKFIIKWRLPAEMFFEFVGLAMPEFIVLSIPMGALLGALLAMGRLSSDNEIIALRASGISLYRILAPCFVAGIVLSCVTFLGNELVVPYCNNKATALRNSIITGSKGMGIRQRLSWDFYDPGSGQLQWVLVAEEMEGTTLHDVVLLYFDPVLDLGSDASSRLNNFMLEARRAEWKDDTWTFYNYRHVWLYQSESGTERAIDVADKLTLPDFNLMPESLALRQLDPYDLTILQLKRLVHDKLTVEGLSVNDKEVLDYRTTMHFKTSIPLTPLIFVIIAVPLAIIPLRSSRAMGMGLSLLIVLVYYSMFIVFQKIGTAGVLPPAIAAWTPNFLLLIVGAVLMRRRDQN